MEVFFKTLLIPVVLLLLDAFPDIALVESYRQDWIGDGTLRVSGLGFDPCQNETLNASNPFVCFPKSLGKKPKFFYALAFVISPWFFYLFEYFHSDHQMKLQKVSLVSYLQLLLTTLISRNSKL